MGGSGGMEVGGWMRRRDGGGWVDEEEGWRWVGG